MQDGIENAPLAQEQSIQQVPVQQAETVQQVPVQQVPVQTNASDEFMIDSSSEALEERPDQIIPRENDGKCVENVYLVSVKMTESKNQKIPQISFTFQEKLENGQVVGEQTIDFTDPTRIPIGGKVDEEVKKKMIIDTISRIKHIARGYISEEASNFKVPGFTTWCNTLIQRLGNSYLGVKGNIKLVYNKQGYISIPQYPISFLSTPNRPIPVFEINPTYDKFQRPSSSSAISAAPAGGGSAAEGSF